MFSKSTVFFLQSLTPLHAGSGSSLSTIDLPVQREKNTNLPLIAGSGVKGAIREFFENSDKKADVPVIFGPESNASEYAGAAAFSDAKLLFFPVKSYFGIFAWITCPYALERFLRDYSHIIGKGAPFTVPDFRELSEDAAIVSPETKIAKNGDVILEDFIYKSESRTENIAKFFADILFEKDSYWHKKFCTDLVIVSDEAFKQFTEYSTEVQTRIKIGDLGTVSGNALFYEENIPTETVFYCTLCVSNPHKKDAGELNSAEKIMKQVASTASAVIQFGGDATIGKGLMQVIFAKGV